MWDMLIGGGVMGLGLIGMGLIALVLFVERLIAFRRESTDMEEFGPKFAELMDSASSDPANADRYQHEAKLLCEQHRGHIAEVYYLAIGHRASGLATVRNILNKHIDHTVIPRLRARMRFMGMLGKAAPMVGLLGTVYGMMGAFSTIAGVEGQGVDPKQLAGDIGLALSTTFFGLLIAIPVMFGSGYLRSRIEQFEVDLERYGDHCLDLLFPAHPPSSGSSRPSAVGQRQSPVPSAGNMS
jgi:biopolymer transport protein ExbB/TolQ